MIDQVGELSMHITDNDEGLLVLDVDTNKGFFVLENIHHVRAQVVNGLAVAMLRLGRSGIVLIVKIIVGVGVGHACVCGAVRDGARLEELLDEVHPLACCRLGLLEECLWGRVDRFSFGVAAAISIVCCTIIVVVGS